MHTGPCRRLDNRPVSRTATQVARERFFDGAPIGPMMILVQSEERHHNARRAVPALASARFDHRLLHGMQGVLSQVLHRHDLFPVYHWEEEQAGIHCTIPDCAGAVCFAEHNRAGSAVAFGTAFFHASVRR
jgi:hypothetical protein